MSRGPAGDPPAPAQEPLSDRQWALLGVLVGVGAALRFTTLGWQSFWLDEANTVYVVAPASLGEMFERAVQQETTPPLYYLLAWPWSQVFGTGEWGLRSLSALLGLAAVPVTFAAARHLIGTRPAFVAAALVACNPLLVWYSQEARSYALLMLLGALTVLLFSRARARPTPGRLTAWSLVSALALLTHYFAVFLVLPEALLLWTAARDRRRVVILAIGGVAVVGVALLPLALGQEATGKVAWIAAIPWYERVGTVVRELASANVLTIKAYAPPRDPRLEILFLIVVWGSVVLLLRRLEGSERRGLLVAVILGSAVIVLPLALAIAGADFFIERNVIAAWVPVAIASGALLGARCASWWGPALAGLLCLGGIAGHLEVLAKPSLQRDNWRAAAGALGNAVRPRALVIHPPWMGRPLGVYGQSLGRFPPGPVRVGEVDLVDGSWPPKLTPPPGFRLTERKEIGLITVRRYTTPSPVPVTRDGLAVGVRIPMSVPAAQRKFERSIRAAVAYQPEGSGREPTR